MVASKPFHVRKLILQERTPLLILMLAGVTTLAGLVCWVFWIGTGKAAWVDLFFKYPSALATIVVSAAGFLCCLYTWRAFGPKDELRRSWLFLMLAAGVHLTGRLLSQALFRIPGPAMGQVLYDAGVFLGGPGQMFLLLPGLTSVARVCRRSGLVARMTAFDYVLLGLVVANGLHTMVEIRDFIAAGKPLTWPQVLQWPTDPLVIALLIIAITIRRSVASMGRGFIASCWASYAAAVVLISIGDLHLWLLRSTYIPWNLVTLGWFVWLLADAAFALGPAYQVAAVSRARFRAGLTYAIDHREEEVGEAALISPR